MFDTVKLLSIIFSAKPPRLCGEKNSQTKTSPRYSSVFPHPLTKNSLHLLRLLNGTRFFNNPQKPTADVTQKIIICITCMGIGHK